MVPLGPSAEPTLRVDMAEEPSLESVKYLDPSQLGTKE